MASLVIAIVALVAVIGSSNKVESSRVQQALDLSKILEIVKPYRLSVSPSKPHTLEIDITSTDLSDYSSDSDESDVSDTKRFARLRKDRIIDLLGIGTKDQINKNRLSYSKPNKNYGQITEKSDDAENKKLAKERIIDLIEAAAKKNTYNNRLTYSKDKKNYGQMALKADDSDNKRLESERIIDLVEAAAKKNTYNNRLTYSKDKKNYGQMALKADDSDNNRLESERIIDLIEAAAKKNTYNNRLTYSKDKKNYGQMALKADDSDNKRLESERIIDLVEAAAKKNTYNNRLTYSKDKNYDQMALKADNNRLESESIMDLIEAVAKAEDNSNSRVTNRKEKPNYGQTSYLVNSENSGSTRNSNNHVQKQILEKLFSQLSNGEERQEKPKKRLIPNRLTPTVTLDDVKKYYAKQNKNIEVSKEQEVTGLEDYSKIYIVLNPEAAQKSKNKNSLNDLVAKVLALSSPKSQRVSEVNGSPRRYKGFVVNDNAPVRRFKAIGDGEELGDNEKKVDPIAVPVGEITAMPT